MKTIAELQTKRDALAHEADLLYADVCGENALTDELENQIEKFKKLFGDLEEAREWAARKAEGSEAP